MKKYVDDLLFLASYGIEGVELTDDKGMSRILLIPDWQGRVLTSTAAGNKGDSFGWINRALIRSGEVRRQFNPRGGEERFWLGPEGGPNSLYFAAGAEQIYSNWQVPAPLDTLPFTVAGQTPDSIRFTGRMSLANANGTQLEIGVDRTVSLLSRSRMQQALNIWLPADVQAVAYRSENRVANDGQEAWTPQNGAPSIWMLGMFPPTPRTTVFLPLRPGCAATVNSGYFGEPGDERLIVKNGIVYFRCDGTLRSKIGLPAGCDDGLCGSYDAISRTLTLIRYRRSQPDDRYVDSRWGDQRNPFCGDVINAYNDGPTETGELMGPFYEIETSSAAAFLRPGEVLCHTQEVYHLQGPEQAIDTVLRLLFGIGTYDLKYVFESEM